MKNAMLTAAAVTALLAAAPARAAYVKTLFTDPGNAPISAGLTFNSKFDMSGGATMAAVVYHAADERDTLLPHALLDLGVRPISWAVNVGAGGTREDFAVPFGFSANLTPTLLGPALDLMRNSGNKTLGGVAKIIDSPRGGVAFGPQWTTRLMRGGTVLPVNQWRFPPGWYVGGLWKFGAQP